MIYTAASSGVRPGLRSWVARAPFATLVACVLLVGAGLTGTWREPITDSTRLALGFAPQDLFSAEPWRMLTSLLVTHGAHVFWGSLAISFLMISWSERSGGTPLSVVTFFASHFAALLVVASSLAAARGLHESEFLREFARSRDVGASGGYYGCLGFAVMCCRPGVRSRLQLLAAVVLAGRLSAAIWLEASHTTLHGDLAHIVSYGTGTAIGAWHLARRDRAFPRE